MYIEYAILDRNLLFSEEFKKYTIWCAYELKDQSDKIAVGFCDRVPEKYKDIAQDFVDISKQLIKPYVSASSDLPEAKLQIALALRGLNEKS